jgi:chromosome segregation ATPase
MAEQAKVTSIDVLEAFRAALIVFLTESRRSLDEVTDGVRRTRMWLEQEQRPFWEVQIRKRQKKLQEAEAELFGAKLSPLRDQTAKQQEDVRRARRALAEAEEKLRNVKKWLRDYDSTVEPMTKRLEGLRFFLDHDMIKALAFLVQAQRTLEGYAEVRPEPRAAAPAPAPTEDAP